MSDTTPTSNTFEPAPPVPAHFQPTNPVVGAAPLTPTPVTPPPAPVHYAEAGTSHGAPRGRRSAKTWAARALIAGTVVGLAALSAYLWVVNGEWVSQNEQLRTDALTLREALAAESAAAELQAEELTLVSTQLENATSRISDLANEEANAIDDRNLLENIAENLKGCSDQRQVIIDVLTDSRLIFPDNSAAQVERETTAACNEVADSLENYLQDRASR